MGILEESTLLAGVCDFGWGSLGKFRLILDQLPSTRVALFGDTGINHVARALLKTRYRFVRIRPEEAKVALVINDPVACHRIYDLGVSVIYVDSLPYLWTTPDEVPAPGKVGLYCAQKFPSRRATVSEPLRRLHQIRWIDPIVPPPSRRQGGQGVVVNLGGLHSHLVGESVAAYINLVLMPLLAELKALGKPVSAVCGNLPVETYRGLAELLPECQAIGRQSPYDFERILRKADLLITSPGSTTILQAASLKLPTLLLPPQNLSQVLNVRLFSLPGAPCMNWPESVMSLERIEQLRPAGEEAVLSYVYRAICSAASQEGPAQDVVAVIRTALKEMPGEGVLDPSLPALGSNGAAQVAQLIRQAILAPLPRPRPGEKTNSR